jgi:dTDP-4-amino-4,6-dideoxygalactose transaminase
MASNKTLAVRRANYRYEFEQILPTVLSEIESALLSGSYILSEEVRRFERAFANYIDTEHAIGVNSGTDALRLALEALDIGDGDEVITVANTFHATALAIAKTGATPVLVDARPDDFLMDVRMIEEVIGPRTKAILPVHLFGLAVDLAPIVELCRHYGLRLVEDCAQATGASINGRQVGSWGDAGCFSFHPSKNLAAAGDAGLVTTNSQEIASRLRSLRYFGQRERKIHSELGHNSKLDAVQAIVLYQKLPFLDHWNELRRKQAQLYMSQLSDLPVTFQASGRGNRHSYHLFQLQTRERDALYSHLVARGVDAVVRYPCPIHLQKPFQSLGYTAGAFPVAESLAKETLCLPLRPDMAMDERSITVDAVREFFTNR